MKTKKNFLLVFGVFLVFVFTGVSFAQPVLFEKAGVRTIEGKQMRPGEIIVKFKTGVSNDVIRQINQSHGSSTLSISKQGKFRRLRVLKGKSIAEMVAVYSLNSNVEYAEPNFIASALLIPNDPFYSFQWHLDNSDYGGIQMESAWDTQTGDANVIVAVVDTGVAYENYHGFKRAPDLANTPFVAGFDFANNDSHPNDDNAHGTHVTGTIAQSTNNNLGVAGVAFGTSIMPVKVLDNLGFGSYTDIADGIYFAADNGADVVNLSLGGTNPSNTLENALSYAHNAGVTIVCAAGNEFQEGNPTVYPAAYDAYCIAVGATRYDETRAYYSSTGPYVDIAAPGGDITVDQNNDGYADGVLQQTFGNNPKDFGYWFYQGTSMAAPHISGVAALLIAKGITGPDNIRAAIESTAEDKGAPGWDEEYGAGIVNAYAALNYTAQPVNDVAVTNISAPSMVLEGDLVSVVVSVANQGDFEETFDVTLSDSTDSVEIGSQLVTLSVTETADVAFNWDTTGSSLGDHTLLAEADTVAGETDTADNSMTTTVTVSEPSHDVAVVALDAPAEANEGDLIIITVTVENQGTFSESTTVSLTDETDNVEIGSQLVPLNIGESTDVSFNWDTNGATISDHDLKAEASTVTGETDTVDNSMTTTTTINEPPVGSTMHVTSIDMALSNRNAGPNVFTKARATLTIVDASNNPVEGATVLGSWSGATSDVDSGVTDATGQVTLDSDEKKNAPGGTTFTFTVDDVTQSGWTYDPASNIETSDSISIP